MKVNCTPETLWRIFFHGSYTTGAYRVRRMDFTVDGTSVHLLSEYNMSSQHYGTYFMDIKFWDDQNFSFKATFGGSKEVNDSTMRYYASYDSIMFVNFTPNYQDFWIEEITPRSNFSQEEFDHFMIMAALNVPAIPAVD